MQCFSIYCLITDLPSFYQDHLFYSLHLDRDNLATVYSCYNNFPVSLLQYTVCGATFKKQRQLDWSMELTYSIPIYYASTLPSFYPLGASQFLYPIQSASLINPIFLKNILKQRLITDFNLLWLNIFFKSTKHNYRTTISWHDLSKMKIL